MSFWCVLKWWITEWLWSRMIPLDCDIYGLSLYCVYYCRYPLCRHRMYLVLRPHRSSHCLCLHPVLCFLWTGWRPCSSQWQKRLKNKPKICEMWLNSVYRDLMFITEAYNVILYLGHRKDSRLYLEKYYFNWNLQIRNVDSLWCGRWLPLKCDSRTKGKPRYLSQLQWLPKPSPSLLHP